MKKHNQQTGSGLCKVLSASAFVVVIVLSKANLGRPLVKAAAKSPSENLVTRGIANGDSGVDGFARTTPRQSSQGHDLIYTTGQMTRVLVKQTTGRQETQTFDDHRSPPMEPGLMSSQLQQGPQ